MGQPTDGGTAGVLGWGRRPGTDPTPMVCAMPTYARGIEPEPDMHETLNDRGLAIADRAKHEQGKEADRLLRQACDAFARAVEIDPEDNEALCNWGATLGLRAKRTHGGDADRLFGEACDRFARAVELGPDTHKALNNWGIVLVGHASRKQGGEAEGLYERAIEVYERALRVQPGNSHTLYNMGCLEATRGRTIEALAWLDRWRVICPSTPRKALDEDPDFDRIRDEPAFRALVESLPV